MGPYHARAAINQSTDQRRYDTDKWRCGAGGEPAMFRGPGESSAMWCRTDESFWSLSRQLRNSEDTQSFLWTSVRKDNSMARPRLADYELRKPIKVWCSCAEAATIQANAKRSGCSTSDYLRRSGLKVQPVPRPVEAAQMKWRDLARPHEQLYRLKVAAELGEPSWQESGSEWAIVLGHACDLIAEIRTILLNGSALVAITHSG